MKLQKAKQLKTIGTAVSLALLLAAGNVSAGNGNGNGKSNSPNKGATYGESVGVSSTCALDAAGTLFQVTTTVTDKNVGDTVPLYGTDMSEIFYLGKERGPHKKYKIETTSATLFTGKTGTIYNALDLCAARTDGKLLNGTVSLDSLISVQVSNSKGGTTYTAQCSDDPDTSDNEGKVVIDVGVLDYNCKK